MVPAPAGPVARQAAKSVGGSLVAFGSYFATATTADMTMDPQYANGLGLGVAATVNMALQRSAFAPGRAFCQKVVARYLAAEGLILAMQQGTFVASLPSRDKVAAVLRVGDDDPRVLMALRAATQAAVFAAVSFPVRRYWVFA
eukprot:gnl/TRDRNA2_/TRDRNA2_198733_c0_seq1.p2 gnl/TRDRNA2_/TRDRNA2_198733_c0~~gnl/TRDRNA2_/TRDRNA2_198733_c0_seq1.p2  ORF type:complete len:143 (-),score=20.72 gnl/TRDRNA2_/TRDRNA2_198733_c0_seq1:83-511(-)